MIGTLFRRFAYWIHFRRREKEVREEIEFHRAMAQERFQREGLAEDEARLHAHHTMGNRLAAVEDAREVWLWSWLDQFIRDSHVGARSLVRSPGFTIFVTLILSIAIGATLSVVAYTSALFFRPLRIPDSSRFVRIYGARAGDAPIGKVSYSTYLAYRDRNHSLASIGMATSASALPLRLSGPGTLPVDIVQPVVATHGLFKSLAADMILGRGIEAEDEHAGAANVVVLNPEAWNQYFSRDPGILQKAIYLNNEPYRVVGVAPESVVDALSLFSGQTAARLFIPLQESATPAGFVDVVGRMSSGVSRPQVEADLSTIAAQIQVEKNVDVGVTVERADLPPSWLIAGLASLLSLFLVITFSVLLIACDDIAIMLLARITARQRELGIRVALGGSRGQLVRQLITENLLLAVLSGCGAMIFMLMVSRLIERLPFTLPNISRVVFDWRVVGFATLTSLATTLFFGLRPALECVRHDVVASISPGSKGASHGHARIRATLLMTQIAVCTALLITTAVCFRAIGAVTFAEPGYKTDHLLIANINFVGTPYDRESQLIFYRRLRDRIARSAGTESLSVAGVGENIEPLNIGGVTRTVLKTAIDEAYFQTLHVSLVAGRPFTDQDDRSARNVAVVNQAMAALFSRQSALGQVLRLSDGTTVEIVGISPNIQNRYERLPRPRLYRPLRQLPGLPPNNIVFKYSGAEGEARRNILSAVAALDPSLLVYNVTTVAEQIERQYLGPRIVALILGIPGAFALLLGIVGTYGAMALIVGQRRREVAVRIACGAHPSQAVRLLMKENVISAAAGAALGITVAVIIMLWLSHYLGEFHFADPLAFAAMTTLVMATATVACYVPARRASRVDAMKVLRED